MDKNRQRCRKLPNLQGFWFFETCRQHYWLQAEVLWRQCTPCTQDHKHFFVVLMVISQVSRWDTASQISDRVWDINIKVLHGSVFRNICRCDPSVSTIQKKMGCVGCANKKGSLYMGYPAKLRFSGESQTQILTWSNHDERRYISQKLFVVVFLN